MRIVIEGPNGRRFVEEGAAFTLEPGERVIGSERYVSDALQKTADELGIGLGDLIAKATKAFGIKPCAPCEKRRQILNRIGELGVAETIRQLKETFSGKE